MFWTFYFEIIFYNVNELTKLPNNYILHNNIAFNHANEPP